MEVVPFKKTSNTSKPCILLMSPWNKINDTTRGTTIDMSTPIKVKETQQIYLPTYMWVFPFVVVTNLQSAGSNLTNDTLVERGFLNFYVMGFCLDPMPLGSKIDRKSKRLLRALSTSLMLFDRWLLLKIFFKELPLKIYYKNMLQI